MVNCPDGLLRCPICHAALLRMDSSQLFAFNDAISRGELLHADGTRVVFPIGDAVVCPHEQLAYPAKNGIWLLLPALAVIPKGQSHPDLSNLGFGAEKKIVQEFYDQFGWVTVDDRYGDTLLYEDQRPVSLEYRWKTNERTRSYLNKTGRYVLDAASGAIPHPELAVYSEGFDYRICLDFSFRGLEAARRRLGDKGIYVLGDMTNLPLLDDSVDSIISLHTLYHIPAEEQKNVLRELCRVLKPGGCAVIVYTWPGPWLMKLISNRVTRNIKKAVTLLASPRKRRQPEVAATPAPPKLYCYTYPYSWFVRELKALGPFQLACWRSINPRSWSYGKQLLSILCWLEGRFPWIFGRIGQYPMFVVRKPAS